MFSHSRIVYPRTNAYQFSMSLNLNIRTLRQSKGLTLAQLAEKVGVSTAHMSEVERGIKNLNNHLLLRISDALGVTPEMLISNEVDSELSSVLATMKKLSEQQRALVRAYAEGLLAAQDGEVQKQ